jgi:hypothetical protein
MSRHVPANTVATRQMRNSLSGVACTLAAVLMLSAAGQAQQRPGFVEDDRPAPRHEDGRINFGPPEGQSGYWTRRTANLVINPDSYEARATQSAPIHIDDVPIQPWAKALTNFRHRLFLASEPYTRCKPAGGPRQIMSPYGFEIVDMPELERIYIITTSNAMTWRIVYMDGRGHPQNLRPSYFGHSIGHWEGDALVVDTIGFNEKFWFSRDGLPTTSKLHVTERYTRPNFGTLIYDVTIDDPGAYDAPWQSGFVVGWNEGEELFEYVCQENNISPDAMIGEGRISSIVP